MKNVANKLIRTFLYVVTNAAFLLLITNINTTCCGPGYQPELPVDAEKLQRYGKKS